MTQLFLLVALIGPPASASRDLSAVRHALESRYHQARTLRAVFYEKYTDGNGGGTAESGTLYFSRPDRMRWDYESPRSKMFLVDGTNVWYYVPDDHVVSRARIKQSSDWRTPIAFLAGKMDLGKFCRSISLVYPTGKSSDEALDPQDSVLRCIPRDESSDQGGSVLEVLFEVQPTGYLSRILIREPGNLQTEFRFGQWQENIDIPEIKFHFVPPPGVSVVDEQSLLNSAQ
jgi:outer membrane lipoprotein carrier protein